MSKIELIQGDCLVEMKNIPDKSIDMILCDLPYEVLHKNNPHAQWDRLIPFDKLWEQYERVIKDNGAIVLFAQGMFTAKLMMSNPKLWRYNLVWDKQRVTGFLNANRMPMRCHEDICVFYKSLPTYNPQYIDGKPNHSRGNGNFHVERRLGCYACPLKSDRGLAEFKANPRFLKVYLKAGKKWWDSHPNVATVRNFRTVYDLFVHNVFYDSYADFRRGVGLDGLFEPIDCKKFLEEYFKIELE